MEPAASQPVPSFSCHLAPQDFLFGSFADGSYTDDSDYDFYIVVKDESDIWEVRNQAQKAIRYVQDQAIDIVVGTNSRFEKYGPSLDSLFVEGEVYRRGKLLYDASDTGTRRALI